MEWVRQLMALAITGVLLAAAVIWLRRRGVGRPAAGLERGRARRLELIDRVSLTPQHSLHLVRVDDRLILVGRSPAGLVRLAANRAPSRMEELE